MRQYVTEDEARKLVCPMVRGHAVEAAIRLPHEATEKLLMATCCVASACMWWEREHRQESDGTTTILKDRGRCGATK